VWRVEGRISRGADKCGHFRTSTGWPGSTIGLPESMGAPEVLKSIQFVSLMASRIGCLLRLKWSKSDHDFSGSRQTPPTGPNRTALLRLEANRLLHDFEVRAGAGHDFFANAGIGQALVIGWSTSGRGRTACIHLATFRFLSRQNRQIAMRIASNAVVIMRPSRKSALHSFRSDVASDRDHALPNLSRVFDLRVVAARIGGGVDHANLSPGVIGYGPNWFAARPEMKFLRAVWREPLYFLFASRKSGGSESVNTTSSSPVMVLMSWWRLTTLQPVTSMTIASISGRAVSMS